MLSTGWQLKQQRAAKSVPPANGPLPTPNVRCPSRDPKSFPGSSADYII
jgi:hypothetical protein